MSNKKPNNKEKAPQRDHPALEAENDQTSTEDESSPSSLQHTSSECGDSSVSASANTTGNITYFGLPNEPRTEPDGRNSAPSPSFPVTDRFFCREESTGVQESRSNLSLAGSTNELLPPSPPAEERRPPDTLDVPPRDLSIPTISVTKDETTENLPASEETGARPKTKGAFGSAFSKLKLSFSPKKERLSPSDTSVSPGSSISADTSPSGSSDKQKSKKSSTLGPLQGKEKSSKNSPDKKKKSPSKFKRFVENAFSPKKLFPQRCADEASEQLCGIEDPPKTKSEKPKRSKPYWESVRIPKDFNKVDSITSDTTVDSLSTQCTITTDSPMSETLSSNQGDVTDPAIPPIPESSKPESDEDEKSDVE